MQKIKETSKKVTIAHNKEREVLKKTIQNKTSTKLKKELKMKKSLKEYIKLASEVIGDRELKSYDEIKNMKNDDYYTGVYLFLLPKEYFKIVEKVYINLTDKQYISPWNNFKEDELQEIYIDTEKKSYYLLYAGVRRESLASRVNYHIKEERKTKTRSMYLGITLKNLQNVLKSIKVCLVFEKKKEYRNNKYFLISAGKTIEKSIHENFKVLIGKK